MTAGAGPEMPPFWMRPAWSLRVGTTSWISVLLPLTLLSVLLCSVSIRMADHQRETLLLADTTAGTNRSSALKWRATGTTTLQPSFWAEAETSRATLTERHAHLHRVEEADASGLSGRLQAWQARSAAPTLGTVTGLLSEFPRATDREFFLLRAGDRAGAREMDDSRVEPLAARPNRLTARVRHARALEARHTVALLPARPPRAR